MEVHLNSHDTFNFGGPKYICEDLMNDNYDEYVAIRQYFSL